MHIRPTTALSLLALQCALHGAAAAQGSPGYETALARYKETITRRPFLHHTDGRETLAKTGTPEALQILAEDYARKQDYTEYARYTIATLLGRHFAKHEALAPLAALRRANTKPVDTWLWVQTLRIEIDRAGDAEAVSLAREDKSTFVRAAAIVALGASDKGGLRDAIVATCLDFPRKEADRNLLLGAMSGALYARRKSVNEPDYREALTAYIGLLAEPVGLTHTAKVQMARHLQWILNGPALFVNPEPWLELLSRGEVKKPASGGTSAAPRFFGIETDGERICYVVDMSDSMLKEISPAAKPAAAVTGPKQKKKKALLDESDLPWHKIRTRWDLAREQLRISLLRLTPDKHFSVVWFGDTSGTLESCKGIVRATKGNIDRVIAELDSIDARDPDPQPRDGRPPKTGKVLRGDTNMHSGIRRAFGLAGRGVVDSVAYVDPDALTEGCDTIFLLSDGAPTMDDFYVDDRDYGEGVTVSDHETGAPAPRTPRLWYHGPFDQDEWLIEDVRRMNAFRRIRMHCIGLGEANMTLLRRLAEVGHGETFAFGQQKAEASKGGPSSK
jgi:hypothetical protein